MKKIFAILVIAIFCLLGLSSCAGSIWTTPYTPYYTPYRPYYYHVPPPHYHHHHHYHRRSPRHHSQVFGERGDVVMFNALA